MVSFTEFGFRRIIDRARGLVKDGLWIIILLTKQLLLS